ncbi:hypothetical protein [Dinoroseobacter sp. S124A]|uniref:hypothetical protein n=1 Tax=Dinoroseobacter sp. S124A TaxID=3415128 RepID=UPI003C7A9443
MTDTPTSRTIETVLFKLVPGADPQAFRDASAGVTRFVEQRPGFIARRLSHTEDGTWIEHIEWAGLAEARAAAAEIGKDPSLAEFMKAIDGPSVQLFHSTLAISVN